MIRRSFHRVTQTNRPVDATSLTVFLQGVIEILHRGSRSIATAAACLLASFALSGSALAASPTPNLLLPGSSRGVSEAPPPAAD